MYTLVYCKFLLFVLSCPLLCVYLETAMCVKAKCRYCGCKVLSPMLGFLVLLFHTWYLYVFIESITQQWSKIIQGQALSMHVVLLKTWFQTNEQHRTAFLVVVGSCHRVGHSIRTLSSIQNPKSHRVGGNLRHAGITFVMCLPEMPVLWEFIPYKPE